MTITTIDDATGEITVLLDEDEARKLTATIKAHAGVLWRLLKEAHDGQAWRAMGYDSWAEYLRTEFDISRSRGYQLIAHADAVYELADAADLDMSTMVDIPERITRDLDVPAAAEAVAAAVADLPADATEERAQVAAETVRSFSERTGPPRPPAAQPEPAPAPPPLTAEEQRAADILAARKRAARYLEQLTDVWPYMRAWIGERDEITPHLQDCTIEALDAIQETLR